MNLNILDQVSRVFWFIAHTIGFVFIVRCWLLERKGFYLWFAASWLLMALASLFALTLEGNIYAHIVRKTLVSPGSSICGLVAFRLLFKYVSKRIVTIRGDGKGNYILRTFDENKDLDEDRVTPFF